jgi:hypothetical protein
MLTNTIRLTRLHPLNPGLLLTNSIRTASHVNTAHQYDTECTHFCIFSFLYLPSLGFACADAGGGVAGGDGHDLVLAEVGRLEAARKFAPGRPAAIHSCTYFT